MTFKNIIFVLLLISTYSISHAQKSQGKNYRVGYFSSPPLAFLNTKTQQSEGLLVDLMNQMAKEHQFTITWVHDEWPKLLELAKKDQIDMITSAGYNAERATYLNFSTQSFVTVWGQVFLPADSAVENIFDLSDKTIAAMKGDINAINLLNQCKQFEVDCNIREVNSYPQLFELISNKEVDGGVSNNLVGLEHVKDTQILGSSVVFNPFKVFVAIPKGHEPSLLNAYDESIREWKADKNSIFYWCNYDYCWILL